jgi:predicted dehydrogenase
MGRAHSNAYRQVTPFFSPRLTPRLKVLCGRNKANVEKAARQLGWDEAATDWEEVVRRPDIDIVDISTPGDLHAPIAIAAAQAGKVVFCEKPLANTVKDAERMLTAVRQAGVLHMLCHNYRRVPAVMLAKHLIEDGQLGEIRHFRGTYLQDWITDPKLPLLWRFDRKQAGSGALGDIAAHVVDLARFLVGEISEVAGDLETFIRTRPLVGSPRKSGRVTVDDASAALVRFANGAMGTVEATRLAPGRKNYNRFEINGSRGSVAFDLERMNELELYLESDR